MYHSVRKVENKAPPKNPYPKFVLSKIIETITPSNIEHPKMINTDLKKIPKC